MARQHETAERVTTDAYRSYPGWVGAVYDGDEEVRRCAHNHRDEAAARRCAARQRRSFMRDDASRRGAERAEAVAASERRAGR